MNFIDKDGSKSGYDIEMASLISSKVNIPVIVGHQGFIYAKDGVLFVRRASMNKVVGDIALNDYVGERMKDTTWPTMGFNILGFIDPL